MNRALEAPVWTGGWYVVHTKPRQEVIAQDNLLRQSFNVYLPRLKVLKCSRKRREIAFVPLFPRYLFFKPSSGDQSIAPVRSTNGVTSIVRFGGIPALLHSHVLDQIRAFEHRRDAADIMELSGLKPGSVVLVTSGPLAGLQGSVNLVAKERVTVLMRLLGEETKVRLSPEELKLAA
jgi:transcriptional antiterminator RfaH